jgi:hypothetical protein
MLFSSNSKKILFLSKERAPLLQASIIFQASDSLGVEFNFRLIYYIVLLFHRFLFNIIIIISPIASDHRLLHDTAIDSHR